MEDAKIEQSEMNYQQGQFPSVITTDDLVFELGKDIIDKLNKEKLLNSLLKKSKALEEQLEQLKAIPQKLEQLQESNKLYEKKNRELGDELIKIRHELSSKIKELLKVQQNLDAETKENKKLLKTAPKKPLRKTASKTKVKG